MTQRFKLAYFNFSIEFTSIARTTEERRAEANAHLLASHAANPPVDMHNRPLGYPEPGVPFPQYVPVQYWDEGYENHKAGWQYPV